MISQRLLPWFQLSFNIWTIRIQELDMLLYIVLDKLVMIWLKISNLSTEKLFFQHLSKLLPIQYQEFQLTVHLLLQTSWTELNKNSLLHKSWTFPQPFNHLLWMEYLSKKRTLSQHLLPLQLLLKINLMLISQMLLIFSWDSSMQTKDQNTSSSEPNASKLLLLSQEVSLTMFSSHKLIKSFKQWLPFKLQT